MTTIISSLAPVRLNTTVCAVKQIDLGPGIIADVDKHSANLYGTLVRVSGANPTIKLTMPFQSAWDVIGAGVLKLTAMDLYLAQFVDFEQSASAVHSKWALTASCLGAATITGWSVDQDGLLMATVEIAILANDATTHPLTQTNNNALPTLASQPFLHTIGPMSVNGTVVSGLVSAGGEMGQELKLHRNDGDRFPRYAGRLGGMPKLMGGHSDPITMLGATGLLGANITSNVIQYFRRYDATTGLVGTANGISITAASGRIHPAEMSASHLEIPKLGIEVHALSSTSTHPLVISTSATVPAT
jgi:hypothetical protein